MNPNTLTTIETHGLALVEVAAEVRRLEERAAVLAAERDTLNTLVEVATEVRTNLEAERASLAAALEACRAESPPPAPPPVLVTPSGEAPPFHDLPGWKLVFSDDFLTDVSEGSFLGHSPKWKVYPDGWMDTSKRGRYSPSKVLSIQDSKLIYRVRTENGVPLVAAPTPVYTPHLYGRFAVRWRSDPLPGYKVAWLLWPDTKGPISGQPWPENGEIDFPECSLGGTGKIQAYMHRQNATAGSDQAGFTSKALCDGSWHTCVIEWRPGLCTFLIDGTLLGSTTTRVPNTPLHWVLQTETNLNPSPAPDPAVAGEIEIDWCAMWAPA